MATPFLTSRNYLNADAYANRRLAVSSVGPVACGYESSCVCLNADAYRFSRPGNAICLEGDRI
jgi:hypothetical protein